MFGGCHFASWGGHIAPNVEVKKHYVDSSHLPETAVLTALNTNRQVLERNNRGKKSSRKGRAKREAQMVHFTSARNEEKPQRACIHIVEAGDSMDLSGHSYAEVLKSTDTQTHTFTDRNVSLCFCMATLQVFNTGILIMLSHEGRKAQSSNRLRYHNQFLPCLLRSLLLQHTPPEGSSSSSSQVCASNLERFGGRDKGSSVHLFGTKPAITCLLRMLSLF